MQRNTLLQIAFIESFAAGNYLYGLERNFLRWIMYAMNAIAIAAITAISIVEREIGLEADERTAISPACAEGTSTVHVEGFTV